MYLLPVDDSDSYVSEDEEVANMETQETMLAAPPITATPTASDPSAPVANSRRLAEPETAPSLPFPPTMAATPRPPATDFGMHSITDAPWHDIDLHM